jgi:hypothetical protein
MRRLRHVAPLFLAAIFWMAQLQGAVHGIGHVNAPSGVSDHLSTPHSLLCGECAAFAQAGAAPIPNFATASFAPSRDEATAGDSPRAAAAPRIAAYRSRAPPASPT